MPGSWHRQYPLMSVVENTNPVKKQRVPYPVSELTGWDPHSSRSRWWWLQIIRGVKGVFIAHLGRMWILDHGLENPLSLLWVIKWLGGKQRYPLDRPTSHHWEHLRHRSVCHSRYSGYRLIARSSVLVVVQSFNNHREGHHQPRSSNPNLRWIFSQAP